MAPHRVVYRTWLVEKTGQSRSAEPPDHRNSAPEILSLDDHEASALSTDQLAHPDVGIRDVNPIQLAVRKALNCLADDERQFIERFYFRGQEYRTISQRSGRTCHSLSALHDRALRRLRKELGPFVQECFGIQLQKQKPCLICQSPHLSEIDRLLAERDRSQPWSATIRTLRNEYGLIVKTPQILIGHQKYH